ncbi:hypothetical protein TorRG33x02_253600 [Trema orientale]|uniref:Uncharacterized protein n=1 Tax=Trema orientale TaxID=63057 RepID=A0A2P5DEQ0_TREOI|nr:hypothetical protein TorRG33x02_253600 [Trema orientale]
MSDVAVEERIEERGIVAELHGGMLRQRVAVSGIAQACIGHRNGMTMARWLGEDIGMVAEEISGCWHLTVQWKW